MSKRQLLLPPFHPRIYFTAKKQLDSVSLHGFLHGDLLIRFLCL